MGRPRTWEQMVKRNIELLESRTGEGLDVWNARVRDAGIDDERKLRAWLTEQGVTGYPQMMLVMERFGYPDFLLATADELLDGQYADRESLRPILDRFLEAAAGLGDVVVQIRKTYVALETPRRQFAALKPTTKSRCDIGLRLDGVEPDGARLQKPTSGFGGSINVRVPVASPNEIDDDVVEWLAQAYEGSA